MTVLARVVFPLPLDQSFLYAVPEDQRAAARPGARVIAPLGARRQNGFIVAVTSEPPAAGIKVKELLKVLDDRVARKKEIFEHYKRLLGNVPGIDFMPRADYGEPNHWLTAILIHPKIFGADREDVRLALETENIESRPLWKPMHMQPVFKNCKVRGGSVSEDLFSRGLCLPSGTQLSNKDLERIAGIVKGCQKGG